MPLIVTRTVVTAQALVPRSRNMPGPAALASDPCHHCDLRTGRPPDGAAVGCRRTRWSAARWLRRQRFNRRCARRIRHRNCPCDRVPGDPWDTDPWSRGSYSALPVGTAASARYVLAEAMIGGRVALAGEYTAPDFPATVHGALNSGRRAAAQIIEAVGTGGRVVVVGAGIAGLAAAQELRAAGSMSNSWRHATGSGAGPHQHRTRPATGVGRVLDPRRHRQPDGRGGAERGPDVVAHGLRGCRGTRLPDRRARARGGPRRSRVVACGRRARASTVADRPVSGRRSGPPRLEPRHPGAATRGACRTRHGLRRRSRNGSAPRRCGRARPTGVATRWSWADSARCRP